MSISCQYDSMRYPFFLSDLSKSISVEGELRLADNSPSVDKLIWGDFTADAPALTVFDDLLVISGKVYPHLLFLAKPEEKAAVRETNADEDQSQGFERREYRAHWDNINGVDYEGRFTIPGLRAGMLVDVDLSPSNATFEEVGPGQIRFHGQLEVMVHAVENQAAQVVCEVVAESPMKVNVAKEPAKLEELLDVQKEIIPVQTPLILSNLKPGAARILTYQVKPAGVNWELGRDKIFIKGFLEVGMVYIGCDDDGRSTEIFAHEWNRAAGTAVPFETSISMDTAGKELMVLPRIKLSNGKLEMKTPREMRYQVDVQCEAVLSEIVQKDVVVNTDCSSDQVIDVLKNLINFEEYLGEKTGVINLDTTLSLPGGASPERLLIWDGSAKDITLEAAEDKVLVEGSLDLKLLYVTDSAESSGVQVANWDRANNCSIPLAGVIDFPGLQSGTLLRAQVQVDSLNLELTGDKAVQVNGGVKLRVMARTPRAFMALRDCAAVEPIDPSSRPSMLFYVVQPGDTLWKIARHYQTTVDALAQANQVANPDRIDIGRKLLIPKLVG
jgi:LysM repeat protein